MNSVLQKILRSILALRLHFALAYWLIGYAVLRAADALDTAAYEALFAFTLTLFASHLINRAFDTREDSISQPEQVPHSPYLVAFSGAALMGIALGILIIAKLPALPLLFFMLMGVLYSVPVFGWRLKSSLLLKNISAAGSWYASFVILVSFYTGISTPWHIIASELLPILFFLLAYELLHDMRDIEGDIIAKNRTIPSVYGFTAAKTSAIAVSVLGIYLLGAFTLPATALAATVIGMLFITKETPRIFFEIPIYIQIVALFFSGLF